MLIGTLLAPVRCAGRRSAWSSAAEAARDTSGAHLTLAHAGALFLDELGEF